MKRFAANTKLIICGCAGKKSPAVLLPPPTTPISCLSTGPATALTKRGSAFSINIGGLELSCDTDDSGNPNQNCLSSIVAFCDNSTGYFNNEICKTLIDSFSKQSINSYWFNYRKFCGKWSFYGTTGSVNSDACIKATNALHIFGYYFALDGNKIFIDPMITEGIKEIVWLNPNIN